MYRYFCTADKYEYYYNSTGERNIFKDLLDSFMFSDESKRRASGFKLKSLVMSATHELDDWDLNCSLKLSPRYVSSTNSYDFSPYFSLSVSWRPMSGMKTEILDEYGSWSLN